MEKVPRVRVNKTTTIKPTQRTHCFQSVQFVVVCFYSVSNIFIIILVIKYGEYIGTFFQYLLIMLKQINRKY